MIQNTYQTGTDVRSGSELPDGGVLVSIGKGFSRIFWGFLGMLVLCLGNAELRFYEDFAIPAYVLGCVVMWWGVSMLDIPKEPVRSWKLRLRDTRMMIFMVAYFAPFLQWTKLWPEDLYFCVNMIGMAFAVILLTLSLNRLAYQAGLAVGIRTIRVEAGIYLILVVVLQFMFVYGVLWFACIMSWRGYEDLIYYLHSIIRVVSGKAYVILMIPFSLNLMLLWRIRDKSYSMLLKAEQ